MDKNKNKLILKTTSEDQLLRKLCSAVGKFTIQGLNIEILDVHIHPDGVGSSLVYHEHSFVEIHTIDSGSGSVYANNHNYDFTAGDFTINKPQQVHYWEVTKRPLVMHVWWIKLPKIDSPKTEAEKLFAGLLNTNTIVHKLPSEFNDLYVKMMREADSQNLCFDIVAKNLIEQILIVFARAVLNKKKLKSKIQFSDEETPDRIVKAVNQYLKDNLASPVSLEEIAKFAATSKRNITRLYRKSANISIGDKLNKLRMYRAEELLRETDLPVKAVALNCGIPDIRYFARKFRSFFNCSPSEFRNKLLPTRVPPLILNEADLK